MIFLSLGIFYLKLQYLIDDNQDRITAKRPLKLQLTYRKGRPVLRCSIGKSVSWIELPPDLDIARTTAAKSVEHLRRSIQHVAYEDAS